MTTRCLFQEYTAYRKDLHIHLSEIVASAVIMDVSILNEQLEDERRTVAQLQKKVKDYQVA